MGLLSDLGKNIDREFDRTKARNAQILAIKQTRSQNGSMVNPSQKPLF
jgi:hypothetical protein